MFDVGFAELLIIGVVALIVIGPERLPGAIRTASAWINRFRRGFNEIKQEVQQELHNDAVMQDLKQLKESGEDLRRETESLQRDLSDKLLSDPAEKRVTPSLPEPLADKELAATDQAAPSTQANDATGASQQPPAPDGDAVSPQEAMTDDSRQTLDPAHRD